MHGDYLLLYSSNVAVYGKQRCAIYALDKAMIYVVPVSLYKVLKKLELKPYDEVLNKYVEDKETLGTYVKFLLEENLAFFTSSPECFPRLNINYHPAELINSAIVEFYDLHDLRCVINQLDECNCKFIRLYINSELDHPSTLHTILETFSYSTIKGIELVFNYMPWLDENELKNLLLAHTKLSSIIVCNSPGEKLGCINNISFYFIKMTLPNVMKNCKIESLLVVNYKFFFESHFFNPVYNGKVFIDKRGNIKNSFFTKTVFGNIKIDNIFTVVSTLNFQRLWKLLPTKFRDSAFRYCLYNPSIEADISQFKNCKILGS